VNAQRDLTRWEQQHQPLLERATAIDLLHSPPTQEGVEDLLWAITMLPEFQIIR
jgi:hypothetical protein